MTQPWESDPDAWKADRIGEAGKAQFLVGEVAPPTIVVRGMQRVENITALPGHRVVCHGSWRDDDEGLRFLADPGRVGCKIVAAAINAEGFGTMLTARIIGVMRTGATYVVHLEPIPDDDFL